MTGQLVMEIENVIDANFCQEDLRNIGALFGAQVSNFIQKEQDQKSIDAIGDNLKNKKKQKIKTL